MPTPDERLAEAYERLETGQTDDGFPLTRESEIAYLLTIVAFDVEPALPKETPVPKDKPTPKPADQRKQRGTQQRPATQRGKQTR